MRKLCKKILIILLVLTMINSYVIPLEVNMVYAVESLGEDKSNSEDDNNPLAFKSVEFKQKIIDDGWDTNNDGELTKAELSQVRTLSYIDTLEYPEYFESLTELYMIVINANMSNYKELQQQWQETINKIPNQQVKNNITYKVNINIGKREFSTDNIVFNLNDDFSYIMDSYNATSVANEEDLREIHSRSPLTYRDSIITLSQDVIGNHDIGVDIQLRVGEYNTPWFCLNFSWEIEDDGSIPNLVFEHEDFKQAIINCGYDKNNDGEINIPEMRDIYVLDCEIKHLEYPEYLQKITTLCVTMECTMENLVEVQQNWKEQIDRIPSASVKDNIYFNVKLDLGKKNYCDESIDIDMNNEFSTILSYSNGFNNSYIDINYEGIPYFYYSGIEYENNIIKIQQDILGKHSYFLNLSVFDELGNSKPFGISISIEILDDGNINNLSFDNLEFKQYLIDYGYDINNDGEISRPEIYNISWLSDAPDIEYPEYFKSLNNINFKLECTLANAKEKQNEIAEKANLIGNKNCTWRIDNIKVNIGGLKQSQENYIIDLNDYFSEVIKKFPYTFKDYTLNDYSYSSEYNTDENAISFQNNKIIINRNIFGKFDRYLNYNMIDENENQQSIYYEFVWTTFADGDETKEVIFEDNKIKNYLLDDFDFDRDEKLTEFEMAQIESIDLYSTGERITSLEGLEYAVNLKNLRVFMSNIDSNISSISELNNLEYLMIYNGDMKDYLKELTNLKTVDMGYTKIDVNNLNNNIENFSYLGYNLSNIESIKNYDKLIVFSFWNMSGSENINYNFLKDMYNLKTIHVSDEIGIINIDELKDLENLTSISFRNVSLENIDSFNNFKSNDINHFELSGCKISNIDFINKFTKLNYIDLSNNNITDISILNGIFKNTNAWNYANLIGNNINPNEEENARTIEYFESNNIDYRISEYDESEEVIFHDENFKNYLLNSTDPRYDINNDGKITKNEMEAMTRITINNNINDISGLEYAINLKEINFNCYNTTNDMDLTPLKDLENIEKISCMCEFSNMNGFEFLNNKNSLKEIDLYNYPHKFDFDGIEDFVNLETIKIHINQYDGDETQLINTQGLKQLTKLKKLDISLNGGTIPSLDIAKISNLNSLELSGKIDNISKIFTLKELEYLSFSSFATNNQLYDLNGIDNLEKLKTFKYSGEIDKIENLLETNKITGLEKIVLSIRSSSLGYLENRTETYKNRMIQEQNFVDYLQNLECNDIEIDSTIYSYVGEIQVGQEKTVSYEDISPLLRALITPNNKLYNGSVVISNKNGNNNNNITINSSNKTITVRASDDIGEQSAYIGIQNNYGSGYDGMYSNSISLLWKNIVQGDTDKKINIKDDNLRNILLEKYDIDDDDEITENDIINIVNLNIDGCNIHSLEGLQNATNLTSIYASNNRIADITPILNLEKLQEVFFDNNIITDISSIKDAKWSNYIYDECIGFKNNFINFEENNENYNALKQWMYKDIPDNRVSLPFVANIKGQNYGNVKDVDKEVVLDANLKNKLIEFGLDTNKDGIITRIELYHCNQLFNEGNEYKLDLSNCNIKNISGLEFINAYTIDLSNNEIEDILPITKNNNIDYLNLSNNKIINITGIEKMNNIYSLNLSNNKISNIEPITNMYRMQEDPLAYCWHYGYRIVDINLSNNDIRNISCVKNWKNICNLDLTNNLITDISDLKDYNFNVSQIGQNAEIESTLTIDLSNNYIDMNDNGNIQAKNAFNTKGANLKVDNQNILIEKDDNNTGIKIEVNQDIISENVELVVDEIDIELNENISEVINNIPDTDKNTKYQVFDIKLVNDNLDNIEPNGNVTVFIPIPKGFSNKTKVYYINLNDKNNTYTSIDTTIETINGKKYAKFETNHFSYYSLVDNAGIGDVNGDGKVNGKDWNMIYEYINETRELTNEEFNRADVNNDGKVNGKDWNRLYEHITEVNPLF